MLYIRTINIIIDEGREGEESIKARTPSPCPFISIFSLMKEKNKSTHLT